MEGDHPDVPWGDRLRRWRVEVRCWSQQELVDQVVRLAFEAKEDRGTKLDVRLVGRWENGAVRRPHAVYRRLLARLGAPVPGAHDSALPAQDDEGDAVLRREFFKIGSVAATMGIAGVPLAVPAVAEGRPGQVDVLRRRLARLRKLDDYLGGADTYHLYAAEMQQTGRSLNNGDLRPAVRKSVLALHAEQAQQAGWAAFDAGWHELARDLFHRARIAASESRDAGLAANSLALLAYQLVETDPRAAVSATQASLALAGGEDVHPRVRSLLHMRGAWTFSRVGAAIAGADALERAEAALSTRTFDVAPPYAAWVDHVELGVMKGRCWSVLGKPLRAVSQLEAALREYSDANVRDKVLYSSWLADSYLDAGEIEKAREIVTAGAIAVHEVASPRPAIRMREVASRLAPFGEVPAVAELLRGDPFDPGDVRG